MPSRFDPNHVHRHFILSEAFCQLLHMVLITASVDAVPHTEAPHGRQTAASRKQVVPHHRFLHVSGKEIQIDTARRRNLNDDLPFFLRPLECVQRRFTEFPMRYVHLPFARRCPFFRIRPHIKSGVPVRIHQQPVSVDVLVRLHGQRHRNPARCLFKPNFRLFKRQDCGSVFPPLSDPLKRSVRHLTFPHGNGRKWFWFLIRYLINAFRNFFHLLFLSCYHRNTSCSFSLSIASIKK